MCNTSAKLMKNNESAFCPSSSLIREGKLDKKYWPKKNVLLSVRFSTHTHHLSIDLLCFFTNQWIFAQKSKYHEFPMKKIKKISVFLWPLKIIIVKMRIRCVVSLALLRRKFILCNRIKLMKRNEKISSSLWFSKKINSKINDDEYQRKKLLNFSLKKTIKWRLLSVLFGRNENVQFLWTCMLHGCIHWLIRIIHNWSLSLLSLANDVHHKQKTKNFLFYCTLSIFSICFLEKIFASEKKRKNKINIIIISIDFCINSSGCCCCFLPSFFPWRIQQQQQKIRNECETREFFPSLLFPYLKK